MDKRLASTWWVLKIALGAAPVLAGLDKFFNLLTRWTDYLDPVVLQIVPVSPEIFMRGVGVVEIVVGLAILTRWTKLGAYAAACWLVAIAANLISLEKFYDVAVRDVLWAAAYFSQARLTAVRQAGAARDVPTPMETSPRGILRLNL
jgi:uncharacterized membrane protein YphA (DoxX/SURF4 family)